MNEVVDDSFLTIWVTIRGGIGEMLLVAILRGMQGFLILGRTPEYASRSFLIQARIVIIDIYCYLLVVLEPGLHLRCHHVGCFCY